MHRPARTINPLSTSRPQGLRFGAGRFRDALPLLSEGFEACWPNTRERIHGRENFIALNENYPGVWRCTVQRLEEHATA